MTSLAFRWPACSAWPKPPCFSFSSFPLTIFHVIGGLAAAVFLGLSVFSVFCKLFTSLAIPGLDFLHHNRQFFSELSTPLASASWANM